MIVVFARTTVDVIYKYLTFIYQDTYRLHETKYITHMKGLKSLKGEYTTDEKTPILLFVGKYLFSGRGSEKTEEIINYFKARPKTIVIELSSVVPRTDIEMLQIQDDGHVFSTIAKILEIKNLEDLVATKNINDFKEELKKIIPNTKPKNIINSRP